MSTSGQQKADASNTNGQDVKEKTVPFPKRPTKKAPTPTQNELKTQRRKLFLRKVAEGREEGRWERRGEDVSFPNQHQHKRKHKHRHEAGFDGGITNCFGGDTDAPPRFLPTPATMGS